LPIATIEVITMLDAIAGTLRISPTFVAVMRYPHSVGKPRWYGTANTDSRLSLEQQLLRGNPAHEGVIVFATGIRRWGHGTDGLLRISYQG
jgi:hypothetical protein